MNPVCLAPHFYEEARKTWLCKGCSLPVPDTKNVNVVVEEQPENIPLNIISGAGLGIIRVDLIAMIGLSVFEEFMYLGKIFYEDGTLIENYMTFCGKHKAFIRGEESSSFRKCEICGQSLYFPIGSQYLTRPLPENTPIAESQLNQIILDEELYLRIKQRKWKKLNIEKLPVCNPKDGRPELI